MTDSNDLFERASREKTRFPSKVGDLTAEQLWDLPLLDIRGKTPMAGVDLDKIARAAAAELRNLTEGGFVDPKPDPRQRGLELRLAVVKRVIDVKMAEAKAASEAAEKTARKRRLLDALAAKGDAKIAAMTEAEIKAELDALGAP